MDTASSLVSAGRGWLQRRALFFKLLGVGFLGLLLLVPLGMVHSTLRERRARYHEALGAITQTWGQSQRLLGPVLVVPYTYKTEMEEWVLSDGQRVRKTRIQENQVEAFFLPEQLVVEGELEPSARSRGIYTAHVYAATLRMSGKFARPDFGFTGVQGVEPRWERARVCLAISDLRGTREVLTLRWGAEALPLQPGARLDGFTTGLHAPVALAPTGGAVEFNLSLTLNGSDGFGVAPLGRDTRLRLTSPWPDPSFNGAYLPLRREVTPEGFEAEWQVSYYGRSFPQQWTNRAGEPQPAAQEFESSVFGVSLRPALDAYRVTERAIKYGVLFIALVFTAFFLFEALSHVRLHALNYLLVGAALCLFFLGLLALSEVMWFGAAYALAAATSTLLIGLYSRRVLRDGRRALAATALLGGVYAYLFFVLRMEDFSLLAGTAALFAMLAALMYATRHLRAGDEATPVGAAEEEA
ncbi:MAG TPA: cell envelope integrity protein CreD [Opitutaceae bacterium]